MHPVGAIIMRPTTASQKGQYACMQIDTADRVPTSLYCNSYYQVCAKGFLTVHSRALRS